MSKPITGVTRLIRTMVTRPWLRVVAIFAMLPAAAPAFAAAPVTHRMDVTLEPATGRLAVRDRITLPADAPATVEFALNAGLTVRAQDASATLAPAGDGTDTPSLRHYLLTPAAKRREVTLTYSGTLATDSDAEAPVTAAGVILDGDSVWFPQFGDALVRLNLAVHVPPGWDAVSEGRRGPESRSRKAHTVSWSERAPQETIHLVAARFTRYTAPLPHGEALVYLRTPDAALAKTYLDATRRYIARYSALLGPYPYAKFALVENFRQTGFGMPSFTLLGSQVIRLPFIPYTSFPHEILHNWWGNGVYVNQSGGNWSEGLTTYLADYLHAELAGRGDAYRRDALARYAAFARGAHDFALKDFHERHSEATQAVGYGKGLMVFHMLRVELGDADFIAGLRRFYAQQRFRRASFDDLRAAFEQVSGAKLDVFFRQWIDRIGAPQLALGDTTVGPADGHFRLRGELRQTQNAPPYLLDVPFVIERADMAPLETTLRMTDKTMHFDIPIKGQPLRLAVDPRFDLFRRPSPDELPASLGEAFAAPQMTFVLPARATGPMRAAWRALVDEWRRDGVVVRTDDDASLPDAGAVWLLGWENRLRAALPLLSGESSPRDDAITLAGKTYGRDTGLALARRRNGRPIAWLAAGDPGTVAHMARALPHYAGKSYVIFAGAHPVSGQWPVTDSPLQRALVPGAVPPLILPARPTLIAPNG